MKIRSNTVFAVTSSLLLLIVCWEITASIIWRMQIKTAIEKEEVALKEPHQFLYKLKMSAIDDALENNKPYLAQILLEQADSILKSEPSSYELSQQAEQNVRQRGNPYSLFR